MVILHKLSNLQKFKVYKFNFFIIIPHMVVQAAGRANTVKAADSVDAVFYLICGASRR